MADSLLDNYNPLYDIHLRQYFALPHMQKHLQKMGLLESTLNLNGDEVYARHHAMMDMMLKNREAQLMKMAELRKKLDAAEKVECCRRIRTGQSPESYRQGKPSRSLSRNRAGQKNGSGGRQRRYSNSFEDRDYVQRIEEQNSDPVEHNTRDPYKRLSANAKRFNYLHKLDDNTLVSYKDNLKKQLQRLERFREISFGPHSVARQPPPPQASWFFRRRSLPSLTASAPGNTLKDPLRSVLNMRGRKATTGNKLNASHDSRTSCPPTTRKRKDSNTRLPPINPQRNRVPTKPPAPVSLQQITTKLPPAAKKPAPTRGRPSNKRQTTTTTTTTITAVSKSPQISNTNTTTLPTLPSVTGHGIFTGAAAAATAAAIGTAAINMDSLLNDEKEPSPPQSPAQSPAHSPVLETQKTFDRSSPALEEVPADILDKLADDSEEVTEHVSKHLEQQHDDAAEHLAEQVAEPVSEQEEEEYIPRQIVLDSAPIDHSHGDYEDSDSEPEYAEEDRETPERQSPTEPLAVHVHHEQEHISPPVSDMTQESPQELKYQQDEPSPVLPSPQEIAKAPPTLVFTEEDAPASPAISEQQAQQSPVVDVHSVVEHFETHDATPQSPVLSVHGGVEQHEEAADVPQSPVMSVHSSNADEHHDVVQHSPMYSVPHDESAPQSPRVSEHHEAPQSPVLSVHSSHASEHHEAAPQSPVLSVHSSHASEHPEHHEPAPQSPIASEHQQSPVLSVHSSHASEHQDHHEPAPQSPVLSVHSSHVSEHHEPASESPAASPVQSMQSSHVSEHISEHREPSPVASEKDVVELSPSIYSSQASEQFENQEAAPQSPAASERSARSARSTTLESSVTMQESYMSEQPAHHSPVASEHHENHEPAPQSPVVSEHHDHLEPPPQSPVANVHQEYHEPAPQSPVAERAPSIHSSHGSLEHHEEVAPVADHAHSPVPAAAQSPEPNREAPLSPVTSEKDGFEREASVHSSAASEHLEHSEHHEPAPPSPVVSEKEVNFERASSVHSSHASEQDQQSPRDSEHAEHHEHSVEQHQEVPRSPVLSVHSHHSEHQELPEPAPQSPAQSVHSSHHSEHQEHHEPAPQSPVLSVHSSHASEHVSEHPVQHSPAHSEQHEEHMEHVHFQQPEAAEIVSMNEPYAPDNMDHEAAPGSPTEPAPKSPEKEHFVPRSPSVHTSDAEEETFEVQHHAALTHTQPAPAPGSPTEMDLYNPSRENQESPVMSDSEDNTSGIPIADRIDLGAYHDSPTKESTSPVVVNPIEVHISAEQVAQQLSTPEQKQHFEEIINQSADEEVSHLIQEALTEAPAIIGMVNTLEEKEKFPEAEGAHIPDAMMTSMYQPSSDHEEEEAHEVHETQKPTTVTNEWDEGSQHVKESVSHSEYSDGKTTMEFQQTVTTITDNGHASPDNIFTDSLVIHEDHKPTGEDQMTQSIYQPHEETEEREWDEGNKHVHETTINSEHTDESGKHFTETVTTTTTVIKSGDDLKNNNDEEEGGSDDEKDKIIEEEEEHGSNGNLVRETITTTTHTVSSGGLPEGGILVDDGDEKNISSL